MFAKKCLLTMELERSAESYKGMGSDLATILDPLTDKCYGSGFKNTWGVMYCMSFAGQS